jgi:hypothetical protein
MDSAENVNIAANRFFDEAWVRLSKEGKCDAAGTREYLRIREEWNQAGRPYNVWGFIEERANQPPHSK